MPKKLKEPKDASGFYEPYAHYNNLLRTWLVAYGVGGPAILVTHRDFFQDVARNGNLALIGWLFLAGVSAQVSIALINKISMWYLHYGEDNDVFRETLRHKIAHSLAEVFWPDIVADVISIACIGSATVLIFMCITP